jgi:hypothetical protein
MNKSMFIGTLFLFLVISIQSNAEMKITPGGITSPNDSGEAHLIGSLSSAIPLHGAVVYGVNRSHTAGLFSYGGYFSAASPDGNGVYGIATGTTGTGVYGVANNSGDVTNFGGYFEAFGARGRGVTGYASGTSGRGVYGYASNVGGYGGYFESRGRNGRAVFGSADGYEGVGVYAEADGALGHAIHAVSTSARATNIRAEGGDIGIWAISGGIGGFFYGRKPTGTGVEGRATSEDYETNYGGRFWASGGKGIGVYGIAEGADSTGVKGAGEAYDFYAAGIHSTNYGPFTGAHEVKFAQDMPGEILSGTIVSVTGKTEISYTRAGKKSLSATLPTVTLSIKAKDKAVFGVLVRQCPLPDGHWYEAKEEETFGIVNALGEGRVWVTDIKGKIQAGDYITTSSVPGYGQLQDDDLLHSYTLGKATETVDWDQINDSVKHDGETFRRYLIAVVYTSG